MPSYERTLVRTVSYLKPDHAVIELGCGTGTTAIRLANHVSSYLGTDVAPGMIAIARDKAQSHPFLRFEVGADADLADQGSYDAVLAFNVLHLFPNLEAVLASSYAALRPGGLLISKTVVRPDGFNLGFFAVGAMIPVMRVLGKAPPVYFTTRSTLVQAHRAAGFDILEDALHATGTFSRPFIVARKPG